MICFQNVLMNNLMIAFKIVMSQNRYRMLFKRSLSFCLCVRPVEKKNKDNARTRMFRIHDSTEKNSLQLDFVDTQNRSRIYDCFDKRHDCRFN